MFIFSHEGVAAAYRNDVRQEAVNHVAEVRMAQLICSNLKYIYILQY